LVARAENGERIVIARAGRPVAILAGIEAIARPRRTPGHEPIVIRPGFDEPLPEFEAL
jgi:antitoxin (DNA-binding transcriptional repressor) of toxin-antitoxin stability system